MANTYTHRIVSLKKHNEAYLNVIKSVVVEITASDGSNQLSKNYTHIMNPLSDDPDGVFIEYNDLTEANVISWITSDSVQYDMHIMDIDKCLQDNIHTEVSSNFPWS